MSDFDSKWLDTPFNKLNDEQLKLVADFHQTFNNKLAHRACVYMMALRAELTAERERADRVEADAIEAWRQVHSLKAETSGPDGFATWKDAATNERLNRVNADADRDMLRERVSQLVNALTYACEHMERARNILKTPQGQWTMLDTAALRSALEGK